MLDFKSLTLSPYSDVLLHVFVAAKEALLGLGIHRHRLTHSDGATTNHGVEQLGLSPQWCALVGDVDAVWVFWTRVPQSQSGPVCLRHFAGLGIEWNTASIVRQEKYSDQCVNDLMKTEIQRKTEIQ